MAMRARIAGSDPRHFDLDQTYYQLHSEGRRARYPETEHEAIEMDSGGRRPRLAPWPVGVRHERLTRAEERRLEQAFVDGLTLTAGSKEWDRVADTGRGMG